MTTTIERLTVQLDEKDAEIEKLQAEVNDLEQRIRGIRSRWAEHRKIEDAGDLPVPRLEIVWRQIDEWREFEVEYRLVYRHFLDHLVSVPLGLTQSSSGANSAPWNHGVEHALPFRDGVHAHHDSAHLGLPLFAIMPAGAVRLDNDPAMAKPNAQTTGTSHRRPPSAPPDGSGR